LEDITQLIGQSKEARRLLEAYMLDHKNAYLISAREQLHLLIRRLFVKLDGEFNIYVNKRIGRIRQVRKINLGDGQSPLLSRWKQIRCLSQMAESGGYGVSRIEINNEASLKKALEVTRRETSSKRAFITSWKELKRHSLVQKMIRDHRIREIADGYLGCSSILNMVVAWRTDPGEDCESFSRDAMMYHFDSDHNRFLKIFVYLDEVDEATGPHMYIPRTGIGYRISLGDELRRDGRLGDDLIKDAGLNPEKICGPKGTIIFADTHNLHKGTPVVGNKPRYIFQMQFVDSLIGSSCLHTWEELMDMNNGMVD